MVRRGEWLSELRSEDISPAVTLERAETYIFRYKKKAEIDGVVEKAISDIGQDWEMLARASVQEMISRAEMFRSLYLRIENDALKWDDGKQTNIANSMRFFWGILGANIPYIWHLLCET